LWLPPILLLDLLLASQGSSDHRAEMTFSSMSFDNESEMSGAVMNDLHSEADRGQADLTEDNLGGKTSSAAYESDRGSRWTVANDEMDKMWEQSIQAK
jgi:hypothetical protein